MAPTESKSTMSRLTPLLAMLPTLQIDDPSETAPFLRFTLFPELPLELRNLIWRFSAYEPRVVKLFDATRVNTWNSTVEGQLRHPAVMHTCKESRSEGSKLYKICYEIARSGAEEVNAPTTSEEANRGNILWINFALDVFVLSWKNGRSSHGFSDWHFETWRAQRPRRFSFPNAYLEMIQHVELPMFKPGCRAEKLFEILTTREYTFVSSQKLSMGLESLDEDLRIAGHRMWLREKAERLYWKSSPRIPYDDLKITWIWSGKECKE